MLEGFHFPGIGVECIRKTCFANHRPRPEFSNTSSPHKSLGCPLKMQTLVQTQRTLGASVGGGTCSCQWTGNSAISGGPSSGSLGST